MAPTLTSAPRQPTSSLDQLRAHRAWDCVERARKELVDGKFKDYVNLSSGAPALIQGNGLMQALAFYAARENHHRLLADQVSGWVDERVLRRRDPTDGTKEGDGKRTVLVLEKLHTAEVDQYMQATGEALELLVWIKQFAKAIAKTDKSGGSE